MCKILYIQHTNPAYYPPLENSSRILAEAGWQVRFVGLHQEGTEAMCLPEHERIKNLILPHMPPGIAQKFAYLRFIWTCVFQTVFWRPDWVYVSDNQACPAGLLLTYLPGSQVIYHEHDAPEQSCSHSVFVRAILACRRRLSARAEITVIPQRQRMDDFLAETGAKQPSYCVWNCPKKASVAIGPRSPREPETPLGIYYHGSINLNRVPLELIEGAAASGVPVLVRVVGYETTGARGILERLMVHAAEFPSITLDLPGTIASHHDLARQMTGMHVGWVNFANPDEDINLKHMVGASNKPFDYLAAGLGLLVPQDQAWQDFFVEPGYAIPCPASDVQEIARIIRWLYEHPVEVARMGEMGRQRIAAEWNYEKQFEPVKQSLEKSCCSNC